MKLLTKILASASIATAAVVAVPVAAQVQGNIATVNAPAAIIGTNAFSTAYQQIGTTYKLQMDTIQQRNEERQNLLQQIDTNGDRQVDDAELEAAQGGAAAQRIQQIEQEVTQLTNQVQAARVYAIEQILAQYGASLQQVVEQQQIQFVFAPDGVVYAPEQADITQQVVTALNTKVSAVNIVPPQGWQPARSSVGVFQQISQILQALAVQQAQQQAAQQQQAPQGNDQAPTGR
jgi:Skp family chaperone for outer membrane proteins